MTWHPFQLNPTLPQDDSGRNKLAYYKEKFGDARTQQMLPRMTVRPSRCARLHITLSGMGHCIQLRISLHAVTSGATCHNHHSMQGHCATC